MMNCKAFFLSLESVSTFNTDSNGVSTFFLHSFKSVCVRYVKLAALERVD